MNLMFLIPCVLSFFIICNDVESKSKFYNERILHRHLTLSNNQIQFLSSKGDMRQFDKVLDEILIPRVVGTPQHKKVGDFIVKEMKDLGWDVETDTFVDTTPTFGKLQFRNIVAKLNPNADRFLVLACHYDSKYTRENTFVGATDSAVPCAMMLNLAKVMQNELASTKNNSVLSLAFIFFDGEEAFRQWGPKDSIYGARHLASEWDIKSYTARDNAVTNHIDRIDVLVLLDLLGARNPTFYSYFPETERWYVRLTNIEDSLAKMGAFREYNKHFFSPRGFVGHIEDDHIPFYKRGVPIVHVIPSPFPDVWHLPSDNRNALHMNTIENLNKILRVFVAEYMNINI